MKTLKFVQRFGLAKVAGTSVLRITLSSSMALNIFALGSQRCGAIRTVLTALERHIAFKPDFGFFVIPAFQITTSSSERRNHTSGIHVIHGNVVPLTRSNSVVSFTLNERGVEEKSVTVADEPLKAARPKFDFTSPFAFALTDRSGRLLFTGQLL